MPVIHNPLGTETLMSDLNRWRELAGMRLLIWESLVSPVSLGGRRALVTAIAVAIPLLLVSSELSLSGGVLIFAITYPAYRKQSFEEELKSRLLLYAPIDVDGYYKLLASIAVGQCNLEMVLRWIQSESRTLQRGIA